MFKDITIESPTSLSQFLALSDQKYCETAATISLFKPQETQRWNAEQKKYFASIFYHLRGHFINFVWYIANFSSDEATKSIILDNIHEEIGSGGRFSHEMLYERFATECGANVQDEIVNQTHYLPFAKAYNKSHLQWLSSHNEVQRIAAFAAYERLDNLDYPFLVNMAESIELSQHALTFFRVHTHVNHFDSTLDLLTPIWEEKPQAVIEAFDYIYTHQCTMWHDLSNHIF